MRTPEEEEAANMMRAALARLGALHPLERLNVPPMIKGHDIEVPMFTLNETVLALKKSMMS